MDLSQDLTTQLKGQILQQACGGDPRKRRRQALIELAELAQERGTQPIDPSPEDLIRQDRER